MGAAAAAQLTLTPTACAICNTFDHANIVYPATVDPDVLLPEHFSARRSPDGVHHRIVRCLGCGLVRSDPLLDRELMEALYSASTFDYGDELAGLRATYGASLGRLETAVPNSGALLDIGCGNGFVLSLARERGWTSARGVEPSGDAIARADPGVRHEIVHDMMRPGLFEADTFDAVTLFQVLDHISDPAALLRECRRILRPGGAILAFNHNVDSYSARLLRERSPIIDVEHTYLYSPSTMRLLFERAGFAVEDVGPVRNTYSTSYLVHLSPLPRSVKQAVLPRLRRTRLGRHQLTLGLGNLCLMGRRVE